MPKSILTSSVEIPTGSTYTSQQEMHLDIPERILRLRMTTLSTYRETCHIPTLHTKNLITIHVPRMENVSRESKVE
jgi:hypothetical protein